MPAWEVALCSLPVSDWVTAGCVLVVCFLICRPDLPSASGMAPKRTERAQERRSTRGEGDVLPLVVERIKNGAQTR
jgi:hypothetical protein